MKNKEILTHLKNSINYIPINILDNIKKAEVVKMTEHDDITRQEEICPQQEICQDRSHIFNYKPLISLASFALIFLVIFITTWQLRIPDSQIYLDVNPSIQITTNKRDKVIKLTAINQDSVEIIEKIDYKSKSYEEVIQEIVKYFAIEAKTKSTYMDDEKGVMLVSIYNKDSMKRDKQAKVLDEEIRNQLASYDLHPVLLTQSIDKTNTIEEFSEKHEISVGKMTFIRNLITLNPELKTEDLVNLSLYELLEISKDTGIDIDKIVNTGDDNRLEVPETTEEPSKTLEEEPETKAIITPVSPEEKDIEKETETTPKPSETKPSATPKPSKTLIGKDKAIEIALKRSGGGKVVDFELDDNEYEVEIIGNDGYKYEIEIDGYSGKIIDLDKERIDSDDDQDDTSKSTKKAITMEEAKQIALGITSGGKIVEAEEDDDEFEFEIIKENTKYEIELDKYGKLIEMEKEAVDNDDDDDDD